MERPTAARATSDRRQRGARRRPAPPFCTGCPVLRILGWL